MAVDADLETGIAHLAQHRLVAPADVRGGQERAVEQRPHAVELHDARAPDLLQETRPEDARDGAARLVRSEREKERGRHPGGAKIRQQVRHAEPCSAVGIDVDLQGEPEGHGA